MSSRTEALLKGSHLRPTRLAASPCKNLFAVGGMTLQKSQTTRHVPLAGGGMTLQIGWRHDPAKITQKWRHEPANWHLRRRMICFLLSRLGKVVKTNLFGFASPS